MRAWWAAACAVLLAAHSASPQFPGHGGDNATEPCEADNFHCDDGFCLPAHNECDGEPQCADSSDEKYCGQAHLLGQLLGQLLGAEHRGCTESEFRCADNSYCIPIGWRCNDEPDCEDLSDELNCTTSHNVTCNGFLCGDGRCIPDLWECDEELDCEDKSDEKNCTGRHKYEHAPPARLAMFCNQDNGFYPCEDKSFCLNSDRVCNAHAECKDGSDEGPGCNSTCANVTCSHGCMVTPSGPYCRCPNGYVHTSNQTCRDLDECTETNDACAQRCINEDGFFHCSCDPQYHLARDTYNCIAKEGEGILFYSLRDAVKAYYLKSKKTVTITDHTQHAVGVASDGFHVYWTEINDGHEAIMRAELSDPATTREVVVQSGLDTPEDVALDWLTGSLYFTDSKLAHIGVCSGDGRACAVLLSADMHRPRAIALHPQRGEMYWTDWGDVPEIARANMDGSRATSFVHTGLVWPNGLFLDFSNDRLYWVDGHAGGIESIRLDGTGRHEVLRNLLHHPYWVSVFESQLYWSDWGSNTLQACEKFTGKERRTIVRGRTYGVHVYHRALMPQQQHACEHQLCSDLCLLRGASDYTCACSEDKQLAADNHTCHEAVRPQYLLVMGGSAAVRVQHLRLGRLDLLPVHLQLGSIDAVVYNNVEEIIYMYDGARRTIDYLHMRDFSAGVTGVLIPDNLQRVEDMAYDEVSGVLYWVDSGRRAVEVYCTRTAHRALLYKFTGDETPISICLLSNYGRMLVALQTAEEGGEVHIDSLEADGSNRRHVFERGFKGPTVRVRYHAQLDRVFITDSGNGIIESAHPEGTGRERFRRPSTSVWSAASAGAELFWSDRASAHLYWANVHDAAATAQRSLTLDVFAEHTQLQLASVEPPPSSVGPAHPCALSRTPCSHICLQKERRTHNASAGVGGEYACACPAGMFLHEGNGTCEPRALCSDDSVYCHRSNLCVPRLRRCDGRADCPHGEDEDGCAVAGANVTGACGAGRFQCGSGECVDERRRCDLQVHCLDKSDEHNCHGHGMSSGCTEEQLECGDGVCVDRRVVCDRARDCADGSDELNCDAATCDHNQFQCLVGNCVPASFECDGDLDCGDGSDEHAACPSREEAAGGGGGGWSGARCGSGEVACGDGACVPAARRCDSVTDCLDGTDEDDCLEPPPSTGCELLEYMCITNMSVCLPLSARCNGTAECPHGEDEVGCADAACGEDEWRCGDGRCVSLNLLCDRVDDCRDRSDETPHACRSKNLTHWLLGPTGAACTAGYQCDSGECLDYSEVCNGVPDCADSTDEHGLCETACDGHRCSHSCAPTPHGAQCRCRPGYRLAADGSGCADVNECAAPRAPCSHVCTNTDGAFVCTCHLGYVLRADGRRCKAAGAAPGAVLAADASLLLAGDLRRNNNTTLLYRAGARITDLALNYRTNKIYFTSEAAGALYQTQLEPAASDPAHTVTNIGRPTKVAVDWISDNVYLADNSRDARSLRVCRVDSRLCARLLAVPHDDEVTALAVDPKNRVLMYCASGGAAPVSRASLYSADTDGRRAGELVRRELQACAALALDPYAKLVYVAHQHGVLRVHYDGSLRHSVYAGDARVAAPRSLALFEDHVYFLNAESGPAGAGAGGRITRCPLFSLSSEEEGGASCESYRLHARRVQAAALSHAALQAGGAPDPCAAADACRAGALCVAVPLAAAHACLCEDGSLLPPGTDELCPALPDQQRAVFAGAAGARGARAGGGGARATVAVLALLTAAVLLALLSLLYYRWRSRRTNMPTFSIHFQNPAHEQELRGPRAAAAEPRVDIAAPPPPPHSHHAQTGAYNEFVNPLREAWRSVQARVTRHKRSHPDNSHLEVPFADSDSDVESDRDIDARDKARLL